MPKRYFLFSHTHIPTGTLFEWRSKLIKDSEWRPYAYDNSSHRLLSEAGEKELVKKIMDDFNSNRFCPPARVTAMAKEIWLREKGQTDEEKDGDNPDVAWQEGHWKPIPRFCHVWQEDFMARHGLSFKAAHAARRSKVEDEQIAKFYSDCQQLFLDYGEDNVINMDETCWRVIDKPLRTAAPKGADGIKSKFDVDEKMCISAIATISAKGRKFPLWVICKGKTDRCHQRILDDPQLRKAVDREELVVTHSENGWMTEEIAVQYFIWLRQQIQGRLVLICDVFAAHRGQMAQQEAANQDIAVRFVPAGQTDNWQPLDNRVFGALKAMGKERFRAAHVGDPPPKLSLAWAVKCLLDCWKAMNERQIEKAWKILD